jgi:flavodoxin
MKILVTYWSQTGNTKKVAEAIFQALTCDREIRPFDSVDSLNGTDLVFIGFPIMQFGPPAAARKLVNELAEGKRIALFVTHAMPSQSDDPLQKAMLEKELQKCRALCAKTEFLGLYHCQGELSEKTAGELISSGIPMLASFAEMRTRTIGHPDQTELAEAGMFARSITETLKG